MRLELTATEAQALGNALESYLSDLRMEIAGTDSWDYRQSLRERRDVVSQVLQKLRSTAAVPATTTGR
jgi:hypothetical protein